MSAIHLLSRVGTSTSIRRFPLARAILASLLVLILTAAAPQTTSAQNFRVYMRVADVEPGSVDEVSARLESAIKAAGWTLLASYQAGVDPDACSFRARVFVVDWPEYTRVVLSQGTHGAFAAPLRLSVFEDEAGVHVAAVNPRSLNRTIVAEEGLDHEWERFATELKATLTAGMGLPPVQGEFGQRRGKGRIGRTMGIMAGGPFLEKMKDVATVPAGEGGVRDVAEDLFQTLHAGEVGKDWGIRPVFLMHPADGVAVMGLTGQRMEARSFSILGRGGDDRRSDMACPGIDHSAAYPVGVLFVQDGDQVEITLVDEMYRMKMCFEDAGKMKFARNMRMPGSIEDEIKNLIRAALF
jgi:uncharacterized protein (DUF302 family)